MKPYKIVTPKIFSDSRGSFQEVIKASDIGVDFKQMNMVHSSRNVLRGLHYQINAPQGKLVLVVSGHIIDVAVSKDGEVHVFDLEPGDAAYIPPGYAHGYWVPNVESVVAYLCTEEYKPEWDRGWNPLSKSLPELPWHNREDVIVSDKDRSAPEFIKGEMV